MSGSYSPVTPTIIQELQQIVGDRHVIYTDAEQLEKYGHDEITDPHYASMPDVVVRPRTAEEIAAIMQLANRARIENT